MKTEQNTKQMVRMVLSSARKRFGRGKRMQVHFEHGQWWVTMIDTGAQFSVVDAEGFGTADGFGFELVTEGEEESE